jgi:hypothetical protein
MEPIITEKGTENGECTISEGASGVKISLPLQEPERDAAEFMREADASWRTRINGEGNKGLV